MPMTQAIDFVIPWVDDSDPEWQAEKAKYSPNKNSEADITRYRDMRLLHYLFRSIEKFAPWVNKVHFITCGHLPKWMNLKHPKLNFVKHTDYIPQEYLPTFNSNTIILNFHRIPNLAENFVFFNDDMFLLKKVETSDFFVNNMPCDQALMRNMTPYRLHFSKILFNNIMVINEHFNKHEVIKKNFFKWFNPSYGIRSCFINWQNYRQVKFSDLVNTHLLIAYKKSEFEYVWQIENDILHQTCLNKFRSSEDVNDWLIRYFRIMKGEFKPHPINGKVFHLDPCSISEACDAIKKQKYKQICANDYIYNVDFENTQKQVIDAFETIFPEKCSFEV
jgi:hypothetical protein